MAVMHEKGLVTRMRRLLVAAEPSFDERAPLAQGVGPEAQRRLQILEIRATVTTHGLRPVLDKFLAQAECADMHSLSTDELQVLTCQLRKAAERVEYACDDLGSPPAR